MSNENSEEEEEINKIQLTLNFNGERKDVEIDDGFDNGDLQNDCNEKFGIDLERFDLKFKYFDEKENKKKNLLTEYFSDFVDPFKFNKGNNGKLMVYVEATLKKEIEEAEKKKKEEEEKKKKEE